MIRIGNTTSQLKKLKKELNQKTSLLDDNMVQALNEFSLVFSALANSNLGKKNFNLTGSVKPYLNKSKIEGGAQIDEYYAPFLEFGTRGKVNVPPELKKIAQKFKGAKAKSSLSFRESIERWIVTKLKKSEEEAKKMSFPIIMAILRNGTSPQPFMYPALKTSEKNLKNYISNGIDKTTK